MNRFFRLLCFYLGLASTKNGLAHAEATTVNKTPPVAESKRESECEFTYERERGYKVLHPSDVLEILDENTRTEDADLELNVEKFMKIFMEKLLPKSLETKSFYDDLNKKKYTRRLIRVEISSVVAFDTDFHDKRVRERVLQRLIALKYEDVSVCEKGKLNPSNFYHIDFHINSRK